MKSVQIVLIEDNPADVLLVKLALEESGIVHTLIEFQNGKDAIRVLCAHSEENEGLPDAILLDLNTPCTDGFDALHQLRDSPRLAGVPIAVLTSSRARTDKQRAALQGARYIEKPSHLQDFITRVGASVKEMLGIQTA